MILAGQGVPVDGMLQQGDISGTQALVLGRKLANISDPKAMNGIKVGQTQGNSPIEVWTGHATELGVTTAQRAGYKAAWKAIQDERSPGWAATFEKFMPPAASLSAAQQDEADALAQQVLEAWRRKHKSG